MALNLLVSLIGRLLARSGRRHGNRQKTEDGRKDGRNDKTTTVTLAAHARRGLTMRMKALRCEILGVNLSVVEHRMIPHGKLNNYT